MEPIKAHVCRSCRLKFVAPRPVAHPRAFSTTRTLSVVPPESPYYVDIPSAYQAYSPYQPQPKGALPKPREIFPANLPSKSDLPTFLANTTRDPLSKNTKPAARLSSAARHRTKMAEQRKSHLREGLTALYARKQADLSAMSSRSQAKQRERANLLAQAEREDARLTNVSVPKAMKPVNVQTSIAALEAELANAKSRHEQKLANYAQFTRTKHDNKMDALHTLYMNARAFVTTEAQLSQLLKQQFDDKKRFENDVGAGDSLWNMGPPDSIKDMIADATGKSRGRMGAGNAEMLGSLSPTQRLAGGLKAEEGRTERDQERLKKIAERLSGGKI